MVLFHGTNRRHARRILAEGINLLAGKQNVDFGRGFYTTDSLQFAERCAVWKSSKRNPPVVLKLQINKEGFAKLEKRKFIRANKEWAQFVVNNRNGAEYMEALDLSDANGFGKTYDVVIGPTADKDIVDLAKSLREEAKEISTKEAQTLTKNVYKKQISFHSEKALKCITNIALLGKEEE